MRKIIAVSIWLTFIFLVVTNVFLFYSSIKLSDGINQYEIKIQELHQKNINLEKEISYFSSLKFAQEKAKELNFTVSSNPVNFDKLEYAFKPSIQ